MPNKPRGTSGMDVSDAALLYASQRRRRRVPEAAAERPEPPPLALLTILAAGAIVVIAVLVSMGQWYLSRPSSPTPAAARPAPELAPELQPGALASAKCNMRDYRPPVSGCSPAAADRCGRIVLDDFASADEVAALAAIAARGMRLGGGAGGPTILDLVSGALSYKDKFVDVWAAFNSTGQPAFRRRELRVYQAVTERVAEVAARTFGVSGLHLTSPCFFSRISADKPPTIPNDEYWHSHIDAQQYGSFVYTALLYLSEHERDFEGGELHFLPPGRGRSYAAGAGGAAAADAPVARVRPSKGRLVLFTSGAEHPHRVTQVTRGTRLTLTIPFTCSPEAAVGDLLARAAPDDDDDDEAAPPPAGGAGAAVEL